MTRALLKGVAYSLRAALDVMQAIAPINELVATGGGARLALWLQIITDILGIKLAKPIFAEGAAYGAALLALIGCRIYPNLETLFKILPSIEEYIQPNSDLVYTEAFHRFTAIGGKAHRLDGWDVAQALLSAVCIRRRWQPVNPVFNQLSHCLFFCLSYFS